MDSTEASRPTEVRGIDHPAMTPEIAERLIPEVRLPLRLVSSMAGLLCNPMLYRRASAGELMALADTVNGLVDEQLRAAQQPRPAPECPDPAPPGPEGLSGT